MATEAGDDADDKDKSGTDDKGKDSGGEAGKGGDTGGDKGKGADKGGSEKEKTYSQADLDAALAEDRRVRKRAATSKTAKTDKGKKDSEDDEESEALIKERQRREQLEEKLRVRDAQDSVTAAAKQAGFSNPDKIYRLVKDDLEFDDGGKPENIKDLIALAKRDFPEELAEKGKGSADGGAGGNGGGPGANVGMNDFIRRAAGRA